MSLIWRLSTINFLQKYSVYTRQDNALLSPLLVFLCTVNCNEKLIIAKLLQANVCNLKMHVCLQTLIGIRRKDIIQQRLLEHSPLILRYYIPVLILTNKPILTINIQCKLKIDVRFALIYHLRLNCICNSTWINDHNFNNILYNRKVKQWILTTLMTIKVSRGSNKEIFYSCE